MWNDPLVTPPPKVKVPTAKSAPAKVTKPKPRKKAKAKPKTSSKLEKDVAALKALAKVQGETIARLSEIVSNIQLKDVGRYAE